jgi:hypothetical protein
METHHPANDLAADVALSQTIAAVGKPVAWVDDFTD